MTAFLMGLCCIFETRSDAEDIHLRMISWIIAKFILLLKSPTNLTTLVSFLL